MKAIEQRVAKLEQDAPAVVRCFAWANPGETVDEAVARQFPEGLAENAALTVFRFAETLRDGGRWERTSKETAAGTIDG